MWFERAEQPSFRRDVADHTPESVFYNVTKAEVWFNTEEAARAAGYRNFQD